MVGIKCTRKLLRRLGVSGSVGVTSDSQPVYGWVTNLVPVMGGELVVALDERTLVTLVFPAAVIPQVGEAIRLELAWLLGEINVSEHFRAAVSRDFQHFQYLPTDSRRMLGLHREVSYFCQDGADFRPPGELHNQKDLELHLLGWLHGPAPFRTPVELLQRAVVEFLEQGIWPPP